MQITRALAALTVTTVTLAEPVRADGFEVVAEESRFVDLIAGRELRLALFGISLQVLPDGRIAGRAAGRDVTGSWAWQEGYFCREMFWGEQEVPYNCQLVEHRDGREIRFTVDRGAGDEATFALR